MIGSTPGAIRAYIIGKYNNYSLAYVLLVGDNEKLPAYDDGARGLTPYWGDHQYAALDSPQDQYRDVMIGRLSAATESDMNTLVNKALSYLQSPPSGDWPKEHLLVASYYSGHDYIACKEDISNTYYPGSNPIFWKIYRDNSGDLPGRNSNINGVINRWHIGTVNYRGHGGPFGWDNWCHVYPYSYTVSDAYSLTNGNYTPIVLSIACSTGRFYENGGDCLTEAFVKNSNGGAVGALGAVEPTYPNRNDFFDKQLYWCSSLEWQKRGRTSCFQWFILLHLGSRQI